MSAAVTSPTAKVQCRTIGFILLSTSSSVHACLCTVTCLVGLGEGFIKLEFNKYFLFLGINKYWMTYKKKLVWTILTFNMVVKLQVKCWNIDMKWYLWYKSSKLCKWESVPGPVSAQCRTGFLLINYLIFRSGILLEPEWIFLFMETHWNPSEYFSQIVFHLRNDLNKQCKTLSCCCNLNIQLISIHYHTTTMSH